MYTDVVANRNKMKVQVILEGQAKQTYSYPNIIEYNIGLMNHLIIEALGCKKKKVRLNGELLLISDVMRTFQPYMHHIDTSGIKEFRQLEMNV